MQAIRSGVTLGAIMAINILTFGVRGVDGNLLLNGNQALNGASGPNELTAANLVNANGNPFQQLLLFVGEANDGDLAIDSGETAYNLSDMGPQDRVTSLDVANTNDPIRITAHGLRSGGVLRRPHIGGALRQPTRLWSRQ